MPKGGARVRSGPESDPNSRTSERKRAAAKKAAPSPASESAASAITSNEFDPMALPASGRTGRPPAFPLPAGVIERAARARELALWAELWKTPQALWWERNPWLWLTVAKYCRVMVATEAAPAASASLLSRERELRNECALSPDGLKMNGLAIAPDQLAERRAAKKSTAGAKKTTSAPVRRLRG